MRRGLVLLALLGCGDPLAPTAWQGELLLEASGKLRLLDDAALQVLERPLRAGLFWSTQPTFPSDLEGWVEQASVPLPDYSPAQFSVRIHAQLPADLHVAGAPFGVGRMLIYWDHDRDGRRDPSEPWVGFQDHRGWIYAARPLTAAESPAARPLAPGYHEVFLPLPCDAPPLETDAGDCGMTLGAACRADADCGDGAECFSMVGVGFPNGICALRGAETSARCVPANAAAVGHTQRRGRIALQACADDTDCVREGFVCDPGTGACIFHEGAEGFRLNPALFTGFDLPDGATPGPVCADVAPSGPFRAIKVEGMAMPGRPAP